MAFTVEDGTGIVTATSYVSVDEADEILAVNIHSKWSLISDEETKEKLLQWASRVLDERVRWNGKKMYPTSGLAWPRYGVRDRENFPIDDNVVPLAVKTAAALLADHMIGADPEIANSGANITALQVDVVMLKFDARLSNERYPPEISFVLRGLGTVSMGSGGYKRIIKH